MREATAREILVNRLIDKKRRLLQNLLADLVLIIWMRHQQRKEAIDVWLLGTRLF